MKSHLNLLYRFAMIVIVSLVVLSFDYTLAEAIFVAVSFLPTAFAIDYYYDDLTVRRKGWFLETVYFACMLLFTQYFILIVSHILLFDSPIEKLPAVLLNPAFIWMLLFVYSVPMKMLLAKKGDDAPPKFIEFTSDRRKVSVEIEKITYIESNDSEVWIHTASGAAYRNKTNISHWEQELGENFIRTHRAFLVNMEYIDGYGASSLYVGDKMIDISRTYRERVTLVLQQRQIT